jgi:hypothetical protein
MVGNGSIVAMAVTVRVGVSVAVVVIVTRRVAVGESAISTSGVEVAVSVAVGNRLMAVAGTVAGCATVASGCGLTALTGTQADRARHTRHKRLRGGRIILPWIIPAHYNLTRRHSWQPGFLIN